MARQYELKLTLDDNTQISAGTIDIPDGPTGPSGAPGKDAPIAKTMTAISELVNPIQPGSTFSVPVEAFDEVLDVGDKVIVPFNVTSNMTPGTGPFSAYCRITQNDSSIYAMEVLSLLGMPGLICRNGVSLTAKPTAQGTFNVNAGSFNRLPIVGDEFEVWIGVTTGTYQGHKYRCTGIVVSIANAIASCEIKAVGVEIMPAQYTYAQNLIMNPHWSVRQRDVTSVSSTEYFCDRWYRNNSYTRVTLGGNGIGTPSFIQMYTTNGSNYASIRQYIDEDIEYNTTYTVSAKVGSTIYSDSFTTPSIGDTSWSATLQLGSTLRARFVISTINMGLVIYLETNSTGAVKISWVKLEKGSLFTGFQYPNYELELVKCQKYYTRYDNDGTFCGVGFCSSTSVAIMQVFLPTNMRIKPTIFGSGCYLSGPNHLAASAIPCTVSAANISFNANIVKFEVTASGLTKGDIVMIQFRTSSAYLAFDAEY